MEQTRSCSGLDETIIETERLKLRKYTPDDFDALYEIISDPALMSSFIASNSRSE